MAVTRRMRAMSGTRLATPNPRQGMRVHRWRKRYKPSDTAKRHRLSDRQPKTERVVSYSRRT